MSEGFAYRPDILSPKEERGLCELISALPLATFEFHGYEANRRVVSFGYDYHFDNRSISRGKPIAEGFRFLTEKVAGHLNLQPEVFQELLATEYPVGAIMNWHRDAPPFELIAGIWLAAGHSNRLWSIWVGYASA